MKTVSQGYESIPTLDIQHLMDSCHDSIRLANERIRSDIARVGRLEAEYQAMGEEVRRREVEAGIREAGRRHEAEITPSD